MLGTSAIRNLIRENKVAQMYSAIQTGNSVLGMQTLDQNLHRPGAKPQLISPRSRGARKRPKIPRELPRLTRPFNEGGALMERDQANQIHQRPVLKADVSRNGRDLFITGDFPPAIKVDGKVTKVSPQP